MENWTVKQLIEEKYKTLGVPHFQRGLVWNNEAMALLLESLYYKTPCGSFLLWKAQNPNKEGTPLPGAKKVDYLIIDGQQRIRNLYSIFREIDSASGEDEEEDGNDEKAKKVWCVNIASLPELSKKIEENKRYRLLFHRITEPGQGSKMVYNMVPLKKVLKSSDLSDLYASILKLIRLMMF